MKNWDVYSNYLTSNKIIENSSLEDYESPQDSKDPKDCDTVLAGNLKCHQVYD